MFSQEAAAGFELYLLPQNRGVSSEHHDRTMDVQCLTISI